MKIKRIIEIDEEEYKAVSELSEREKVNELSYYEKIIAQSTPYNPTGDCISREVINSEIEKRYCSKHCVVPSEVPYCPDNCPARFLKNIVKECPTVDIKDQIAGAYNEGYMCGSKEAEKARPQGEYVDISKLRLMTVEECAGHTIDYAMGWKACIEWIKKGGAE